MTDKFSAILKTSDNPALSPLTLCNLTLNNRVVRSATEMFIALPDGHVNPAEYTALERFKNEPVGLFISGHTCVSPEGRSVMTQNAVWDDCFIADQSRIAAMVRQNGTKALLQIGHGGAKADGSNGGREVITPDNASDAQIKHIVKSFAAAALRAKECGFDGVQLHVAHYYLLSQWFYPHLNHRSDKYGGTAENRFRIVREIAEAVKTVCKDNYPVFIKINSTTPDDYTAEAKQSYFNDIAAVLEICGQCGIEAVELSGHSANPRGVPEAPYFLETMKRLRSLSDTPLMLVGGIRTPQDMRAAIDGGAVTVSMCRPFMRRADALSYMFSHGVSDCKYCDGCFGNYNAEKNTRCVFN